MKHKSKLPEKGITLVALIITIIVLLILAGITISQVLGNSRIIIKAQKSTEKYKEAAANENNTLKEYAELLKRNDPDNIPNPIVEAKATTASDFASSKINVQITNANAYDSINVELTPGNKISTAPNSEFVVKQNKIYTIVATGIKNEKDFVTTKVMPIIDVQRFLPGSLSYGSDNISLSGLKYADIDNDGNADGIIVADISKDYNDTSVYKGKNSTNGDFSYTVKTSGLRKYEEKPYTYALKVGNTYENIDGTLVTCVNTNGDPRYYILSLADYYEKGTNPSCYFWYFGVCTGGTDSYLSENNKLIYDYSDITKPEFGEGINNTKNMIKYWNEGKYGYADLAKNLAGTENDPNKNSDVYCVFDIWGKIQELNSEGWFIPSKSEWLAFASYLNINNSNFDKLNMYDYWSSTLANESSAFYFNGKDSLNNSPVYEGRYGIRMAKTF